MTASKLLTAREIATYAPRPDEMIGNYEIVEVLSKQLCQPLGEQSSICITGEAGTGKSSAILGFLHALTGKPVGRTDDAGFFRHHTWESDWAALRIDGALTSRDQMIAKVDVANYGGDRFVFMVVERLDLLFARGMAAPLRSLDHPNAIVLATAESLTPSLRSRGNDDFESVCGGLSFIETQRPSEGELLRWIAKRTKDWSIGFDDLRTLRVLASRSQCIVSRVAQCFSHAVSSWDRRLTYDRVMGYPFDPLQKALPPLIANWT
jgi:hypothetical protein